ncbi:hypothetical protein NIES2111_58760 (plasmid) [Nostoc sp. NIES-2111]|nr:hypothetical protein NIES2111_58760 [Nostoc sp. NIES-2111]
MPDYEDPKQVNNNDLRNSQFGGGLINADTVNAGRIGGDILNFFFGQQTTPAGNPARPKNERILLAAVKEEVTAQLRQSLHNAVLINLGKESQPQQVKRPWDAEIKIGLKPAEPLPDTTTILKVFDSPEIAGKLLILGAPGSGKTTTQLELAQALVNRAEEQRDYPVPVLFNLSSWKDERQSIADWLVAELKSKYGVSNKLGQEWVNNHQLLPLLDGLDELESKRQESCVNAINQLLQGEYRPQYLVVCSRMEEYGSYKNNLCLSGAIYLQPLTNNQIHKYLIEVNHADLWLTFNEDLELLNLVKIPLFLSLTILASQEISIDAWQQLTSTIDRIQLLLDAYVVRMLTRNINRKIYTNKNWPKDKQTLLWLIWVAQQLQRESQTEFLIEEMQPSFLRKKSQKIVYRAIYGLTSGLIYGLTFGLVFGLLGVLFYGNISGLIIGLILGLFFGLTLGFLLIVDIKNQKGIESIQTIKLSKIVRKNLIYGVISGLIFRLVLWLMVGLSLGMIFGRISGLSSGLIFGLIMGLVNGFNYVLISVGKVFIQHFSLRLILYFNGYIPWNYARFLDYCTERMLLQRVGGRYRFIHKLLQDHFAQMEFRQD